MKNHRGISPRQEAAAERALCQALLTLRTVDECRDFLRDLCTPAELQAMADRWAVVECLRQELPYREIHRLTGVSLTTVQKITLGVGDRTNPKAGAAGMLYFDDIGYGHPVK